MEPSEVNGTRTRIILGPANKQGRRETRHGQRQRALMGSIEAHRTAMKEWQLGLAEAYYYY
jgi:hypothetical protein